MSDLVNALSTASRGSSVLDRIANPPQVNPLGAFASAAETARGIYGVREFQAKQAAGEAFLNSIDPATGQPNQALLMQNLKANPLAAMAAQDAAQKGVTLDADTYKLHTSRLSQANDAIVTLIGRFPNGIPQDAAHAAIDQEVGTGLITPAEAQQLKTQFGTDPHQNSLVATQLYSHNLTNQQQLDRTYGTRAAVPAGGSTEIVTVPPPGPGQPGVSVPHTMDPATAGGQVKWTDNQGVEHFGTGAQYATERGLGHVTGPAVPVLTAPPRAPGALVPPPPPLGTTVRPPAAPVTPALTTPAPAKLTDTSGPAPGVVPATQETAKSSATMGTALTARGDQVPTNKANLDTMEADLQAIQTGSGTEREKAINSFIAKWTGRGVTMTPEQIAKAESFAKVANILVGQQLSAIGGTDARQALFMGSNPNLDLSKLGNTQIIHMLKGNEDAIAAKSRAWQEWLSSGHTPDSYGQFQNDFNQHFDPRVFQQAYMGPSEIASLKRSMPEGSPEEKKFRADVQYARDHGWIP